jgi:CPA2 family monovalent cation:H+ antiporter-2
MDTGAVLLELGAIILGLSVAGQLASRIGISPIPIYLLTGLAFGDGGVLPLDTSAEFVEISAEIGVVLLLLTLGLEYTPTELVGSLRENSRAGVVDVLVNAVPGAAAGVLLGFSPEGVLALAGITYISSSGIVAKLLHDLGRIPNRETPVVLAILVFEDLVMAVYLPLLAAVLVGLTLVGTAVSVLVAVALVGLVLAAAARFGDRISALVFSTDSEQMILRLLGLTLVVAGLAQQMNVSTAVGAFLIGIAISGEAAESARGLVSPLRDLFAAVFFVTFGLRTDPGEVLPVLMPALALAVVTTATKVWTGWWAAGRAGIGPRGRLRAGAALVARGEFSIIIAGLAATGGAPDVGPLATAYVLVMAVAGPLLARYVEELAAPVLRRAQSDSPGAAA